jgi:hypothetical protein
LIALVIALGVWWNSNTISHHFIHRPFFREAWQNRLFSAYLSVLLGFPQALWRELHLAHHSGSSWQRKITAQMGVEAALVAGLWAALAINFKHFFLSAYVPGFAAGMMLCALQGHYEHARGVVSHYGRIYTFLCFNDGYHAEHHAYPGLAWKQLPARKLAGARSSRWPAPLRWLDGFSLEGLERLVLEGLERMTLRSAALQRFVLSRHHQAIAALAPAGVGRATVVGGGLFPRTALVLRELYPDAQIKVIDAEGEHIAIARDLFNGVDFELNDYHGEALDCDLAVIPLSLRGDREAVYRRPPAPTVLVHDWIWRRRGKGKIVSWLLLKRINRVRRINQT